MLTGQPSAQYTPDTPALSRSEQVQLLDAVKRCFDAVIATRGKRLYTKGCVGPVERGPATGVSFHSTVAGSRGDRYHALLALDAKTGELDGFCSCPYTVNCKHSAALAYALMLTDPPGQDTAAAPAELVVEDWVAAFRSALAPAARGTAVKSWQLAYLIRIVDGTVTLAVAQRYRKQNGDWGRIQQLSVHGVERQAAVGHADRALVGLLEHLPTHWNYHDQRVSDVYRAQGALGRQLLEWALRSGHALDADSLQPLHWGPARAVSFDWQSVPGGHKLLARLTPEPEDDWQLLETLAPTVYRTGDVFGPADAPLDADQLALMRRMPAVPEATRQDVTMQLSHSVGDAIETETPVDDLPLFTEATPVMTLVAVATPKDGWLPALQLVVGYGDLNFKLEFDEAKGRADERPVEALVRTDDGYVRLLRDWAAEFDAVSRLRSLGLVPYPFGQDLAEHWVPSEVVPARHVQAWNTLLPGLKQLAEAEGWGLVLDPSYRLDQGVPRLSGDAADAGHGWFDLKLDLRLDDTELDTATLLTQWLGAGTPDSLAIRGADDHWRLLDMQPLRPMLGLLRELYQDKGPSLAARLPAFKAIELEGLDDLNVKRAPALKKLRKELTGFRGVQTVKPAKQLTAELRDYQQRGLDWLMFLHRYGFGGILADDMGLGKTLQTLAFLQRLKAGRKLTRGALIIAPTSLIWNWQKEAERFTANLRCLVLHGPERKAQFDAITDHDLVVTTYALIQRDIEQYTQLNFDVCVLDEAQNIKNRHAKTTRRVKQLPAGMRLCLTGTPLENHLGELWSIADFVLPGLLGNDQFFNTQFRQPIEQRGDAECAEALSRRMAPFMLRRTKAEVVRELPAKTSIVQTLHLEGKQQALYESIRVSMESRVRELIQQQGLAKSRIEFLDALLKLRQACIDPRLVKLSQAAGIEQSAKMTWLLENLPEMVEEGRKILLFSQFTTMLDLIGNALDRLGIETVKLTGRTRKREAAISAFQEGQVPVFLISLKAGGAGLNLTAADTVIHVDPWWNPAVENQATDRAYRIGQDKPVFVYKLVAAGTVEEKIQAMQKDKQALADALFEQSNKAGLPGSGDELLALFGPL